MDITEQARKAQEHCDIVDQVAASTHRRVVLEARAKGESLVLSQDGQVVHVPASEIVLPGEEAEQNGERPGTSPDASEQATMETVSPDDAGASH